MKDHAEIMDIFIGFVGTHTNWLQLNGSDGMHLELCILSYAYGGRVLTKKSKRIFTPPDCKCNLIITLLGA